MLLLSVGLIVVGILYRSAQNAEAVRAKPSDPEAHEPAASSTVAAPPTSVESLPIKPDAPFTRAFPQDEAQPRPPQVSGSRPVPPAADTPSEPTPGQGSTPPDPTQPAPPAPLPTAPPAEAGSPERLEQALAAGRAAFEQQFQEMAESWSQSLADAEQAVRASVGGRSVDGKALAQAVGKVDVVVQDIARNHVGLLVEARRKFKDLPLRHARPSGGFILTMIRDYSCDGPDAPSENRCHWGAVQEWKSVLDRLRSVGRAIEDAIEKYALSQSMEGRIPAERAQRKTAANAEARKLLLDDPLTVRVEITGMQPIEFQVKLSDFVRLTAYRREQDRIRDYESTRGNP